MKHLAYGIDIHAIQSDIYDPIEGVDCDEWQLKDVVPSWRAILTNEGTRRILEGPDSHSREAFSKMVDTVCEVIKMNALEQYDRLEKPHDRIDSFAGAFPK